MGHYFFTLLRRWLWLMIVAALVATATTFFVVKTQPASYEAQSKLLIGPGIGSPSPDINTLRAGSYLMLTYAELPKTTPFLQSLVDELGLKISPEELEDRIEVRPNADTQVLTVIGTYDDADIAVALANKIAEGLVHASPFSQQSPLDPIKEQVSAQVKLVEQSAAATEARISEIEAELDALLASQGTTGEGVSTAANAPAGQVDVLERSIRLFQNSAVKLDLASRIYQELLESSTTRLETLKADLEQTKSIGVQRLVLDQIALEQEHLSGLQRAMAGSMQLVDNQPLESLLAASEAQVEELEAELLQSDRSGVTQDSLATARQRLGELQKIQLEREQQVLDQIGLERQRTIENQALQVEKRGELLDQLDLERKSLDESRHTLALLYGQLQEANTNQVTIIEQAKKASTVGLPIWLILFLSSISGLVMSGVLILTIEYLSDRIQSSEELAQLTERPILGVIASNPWRWRFNPGRLIVEQDPDSVAAESYRMLSTKFIIPNGSAPGPLVMLPIHTGENAAEIAANLAVVLSQAGTRTVLIDANFHQPKISHLFDLAERSGLAEYLANPSHALELIHLDSYSGLSLLPAGSITQDAFQLLASLRLVELIDQLKAQGELVLVSAPSLTYAESLLLVSRLGGALLIAYNNRTPRDKIKRAVEILNAAGVPMIGSIFSNNEPASAALPAGFDFIKSFLDRDALPSARKELQVPGSAEQDGTLGKTIS